MPVYSADPDLSAGFVQLCRGDAVVLSRTASDAADVPQIFTCGTVEEFEWSLAVLAVNAYVVVGDGELPAGNQSLRPAFQSYELRLADPLRYEDVLSLFQVGIVDGDESFRVAVSSAFRTA